LRRIDIRLIYQLVCILENAEGRIKRDRLLPVGSALIRDSSDPETRIRREVAVRIRPLIIAEPTNLDVDHL